MAKKYCAFTKEEFEDILPQNFKAVVIENCGEYVYEKRTGIRNRFLIRIWSSVSRFSELCRRKDTDAIRFTLHGPSVRTKRYKKVLRVTDWNQKVLIRLAEIEKDVLHIEKTKRYGDMLVRAEKERLRKLRQAVRMACQRMPGVYFKWILHGCREYVEKSLLEHIKIGIERLGKEGPFWYGHNEYGFAITKDPDKDMFSNAREHPDVGYSLDTLEGETIELSIAEGWREIIDEIGAAHPTPPLCEDEEFWTPIHLARQLQF